MDTGSSPRVWGQGKIAQSASTGTRIIPTRMGTRSQSLTQCGKRQDHPHAYGDKHKSFPVANTDVGSSPRVWGQEPLEVQLTNGYRIIPTRMGTRKNCAVRKHRYKDHPHAYGDKKSIPNTMWKKAGSSPRVWGQAISLSKSSTILGIIPTRMGTSEKLHFAYVLCGDHPHAYGDKSF